MSESPTNGSALPARRPGGVRAHLESRGGPEKGETFRLAPGVTVIGRDPSCDIQLSEPAISRQHCRIVYDGERFWLSDCQSHNGTFLNGRRISKSLLYDGDVFQVGHTRISFSLPGTTPDSADIGL